MSTELYNDGEWIVLRYWGGALRGQRFEVHHLTTEILNLTPEQFRQLYDVIAQAMIVHRDNPAGRTETMATPEGGYRGKVQFGILGGWHTETVTVPTCWLVMFEGPHSQQGRPQEHYKIQTDDMQTAVAVAFNLLEDRFVPDRMTISRTDGYSWEVVVPND